MAKSLRARKKPQGAKRTPSKPPKPARLTSAKKRTKATKPARPTKPARQIRAASAATTGGSGVSTGSTATGSVVIGPTVPLVPDPVGNFFDTTRVGKAVVRPGDLLALRIELNNLV